MLSVRQIAASLLRPRHVRRLSGLQPLAVPERKSHMPLVTLGNNLYAKLEGCNVGGSLKDRAVTKCTVEMLNNGSLTPGGTLALCTSGSAGVSLLGVQDMLRKQGIGINVKIFMPSAYMSRPVPMAIAKTEGVVITGSDYDGRTSSHDQDDSRSLCPLDGQFLDVLARMNEMAEENGWAILDQHYDANGMLAHESTALEIMEQIPWLTDVVCTTGTGATAAGLRTFLPAHVRVHARPAHSGTLDGCTDVRRYNNFCKPELLEGYCQGGFFDPEEANDHQAELRTLHQIVSGPSSGAAFALAKRIVQERPESHVAFICADGKKVTGSAPRPRSQSSRHTASRRPRRNAVRLSAHDCPAPLGQDQWEVNFTPTLGQSFGGQLGSDLRSGDAVHFQ
eukprot:gnl/TRDRNA2_/TRDRNA2_174344_c0_seq5.p1 gnl/TRDRNA2_/TRDRNA2_174344_c0~~gnl/TRDRNA2_/TRDRNA2_174344_c0_seq5.p1  ORF type:complete len:403 (+),score=49.42 gnl/TRDRNA2_/TRDRNA2_174344_c0_seq5:32-1210(+)